MRKHKGLGRSFARKMRLEYEAEMESVIPNPSPLKQMRANKLARCPDYRKSKGNKQVVSVMEVNDALHGKRVTKRARKRIAAKRKATK